MSAKDGGPAFPEFYNTTSGIMSKQGSGLTVRDYFAAAALNGMLSRDSGPSMDVGQAAYDYADELLAAREAGK